MNLFTGETFGHGGSGQAAFFQKRSERSDAGVRKSPVLWKEGATPKGEIDSFVELLEIEALWTDAEIDIKERYHFLWDEIKDRFEKDELPDREIKTYKILVAHSYGMRLANEVLIHLTHADSDNPNEFGNWARVALGNQSLPHADSHTRPLEGIQTMNMILGGTDVYDPTFTMVVAASLKPMFHDIMQNLLEQQKVMHPEDQDFKNLDPKDDHKESAAFLVHALKPLIKKAGHLSDRLTEELVRVLSASISVHDQFDDFQFRLSDINKINADTLSNEELYRCYELGTIDQMSLRSDHRHTIMRMRQKQAAVKKGYHVSIYGAYGLGDSLEERHGQLIQMAITSPTRFDQKEIQISREKMIAWDSLFNLGDIWEMIIPGQYAVLRKIRVHRSTIRPLISPEEDIRIAFSPTPLDNYDKSDWCRAMYEYRANVQVLKDSPFAQNPLFMEFLGNTVLYNLIQAQKLYRAFVQGENGLHELDAIQYERVRMVSRKALQKVGMPQKEIEEELKKMDKMNLEQIVTTMRAGLLDTNYGKVGIEYASRLEVRFNYIREEFDTIRKNMRVKLRPDGKPSEGQVYRYGDEDIAMFEENFKIAWALICEDLGITDPAIQTHIREYMETCAPQRVALAYPILPNPGFPDSLGKLGDAKTVNALAPDVRNRLDAPASINFIAES